MRFDLSRQETVVKNFYLTQLLLQEQTKTFIIWSKKYIFNEQDGKKVEKSHHQTSTIKKSTTMSRDGLLKGEKKLWIEDVEILTNEGLTWKRFDFYVCTVWGSYLLRGNLRERERSSMFVRESEILCVCVCDCERESVCVIVCESMRGNEIEIMRLCESVC